MISASNYLNRLHQTGQFRSHNNPGCTDHSLAPRHSLHSSRRAPPLYPNCSQCRRLNLGCRPKNGHYKSMARRCPSGVQRKSGAWYLWNNCCRRGLQQNINDYDECLSSDIGVAHFLRLHTILPCCLRWFHTYVSPNLILC